MSRRLDFGRWGPEGAVAGRAERGGHFATRERADEFSRFLRSLPDPDPILRKLGKDVAALQELSDSHLESVWSVRCSAASGVEWFMEKGADGRREIAAAAEFEEMLGRLDVPRVIEEMMGAVAYGYAPLEALWVAEKGRWNVRDIAGKPPQWFEFDRENRLVFRVGAGATEALPENRFLLIQHRPTYNNPYGDKAFSKCFWPVTFKRNGFKWWTVFVEKYGGAFLFGEYPVNASERLKNELLAALERMAMDSVAVVPEGAKVTIQSVADKSGSSGIHADFITAANAEISKAILGETLTTEIGNTGSRAAAQTHNLIREDLAAADRRRVSGAFNRLAAVWTRYNYGADVVPPRFGFVKDEDLQAARAERDAKLYAVGWRPKASYIAREYGMPEEDFEIVAHAAAGPEGGVAARADFGGGCDCQTAPGVAPPKTVKKSLFRRVLSTFKTLFASAEERRILKDRELLDEFAASIFDDGRREIDGMIDAFADALGSVENYADAKAALVEAYGEVRFDEFARLIDEARFAAAGIGRAGDG